jgi:hypothetical protein
MKKLILMLAATVLLAAPAMADMTASLGTYHSLFNHNTIGGGHFDVTRSGSLAEWAAAGVPANFSTFCVENITFSPGTTYYATIDDTVQWGAVPPTTLTSQTKNLYAGYLSGSSLYADDGGLQMAIWYFEGVTGYDNPDYYTSRDALIDLADTYVPGAENVRVLNLWTGGPYQGDVQSQLVQVPAPAAIGLGVLGLALVGWLKRRAG